MWEQLLFNFWQMWRGVILCQDDSFMKEWVKSQAKSGSFQELGVLLWSHITEQSSMEITWRQIPSSYGWVGEGKVPIPFNANLSQVNNNRDANCERIGMNGASEKLCKFDESKRSKLCNFINAFHKGETYSPVISKQGQQPKCIVLSPLYESRAYW